MQIPTMARACSLYLDSVIIKQENAFLAGIFLHIHHNLCSYSQHHSLASSQKLFTGNLFTHTNLWAWCIPVRLTPVAMVFHSFITLKHVHHQPHWSHQVEKQRKDWNWTLTFSIHPLHPTTWKAMWELGIVGLTEKIGFTNGNSLYWRILKPETCKNDKVSGWESNGPHTLHTVIHKRFLEMPCQNNMKDSLSVDRVQCEPRSLHSGLWEGEILQDQNCS